MSSKVRLRDAYSIPTVSYVHHFPVSAGVWSRPDTRGVITSATTRYERMSDKVNLRGSACTIAGTPGRKQDMVRHLRITNFRYVYCSLPHSCSRAHTRGTKTLFLRELLGLRGWGVRNSLQLHPGYGNGTSTLAGHSPLTTFIGPGTVI